MAEKRIIKWEKWVDPFGTNLSDIELPVGSGDDEEDSRPYRDSYEENEQRRAHGPVRHPSGRILVGPMGVIPIGEHNMPSKVFKFWMGHTNFDIGRDEKDIIETIAGVETLDIFTRYRFRISVGKAFKVRDVCYAISEALCQESEAEVIPAKKVNIEFIKSHLKQQYSHWAILVLPSGELQVVGGDNQEVVEKEIATRKNEGQVIKSWDK